MQGHFWPDSFFYSGFYDTPAKGHSQTCVELKDEFSLQSHKKIKQLALIISATNLKLEEVLVGNTFLSETA